MKEPKEPTKEPRKGVVTVTDALVSRLLRLCDRAIWVESKGAQFVKVNAVELRSVCQEWIDRGEDLQANGAMLEQLEEVHRGTVAAYVTANEKAIALGEQLGMVAAIETARQELHASPMEVERMEQAHEWLEENAPDHVKMYLTGWQVGIRNKDRRIEELELEKRLRMGDKRAVDLGPML